MHTRLFMYRAWGILRGSPDRGARTDTISAHAHTEKRFLLEHSAQKFDGNRLFIVDDTVLLYEFRQSTVLFRN